ncbi:hypothetical protein CRE_23396 [Caenorhabditis remanei]|uniref:Uncharacterized protein n=1 Tax=Caenorhabditis remanei TaxID=31234 RepID=E3MHA4_CAERE|nr:hypothetical protein CRE_23396 [Caenorhabditis remanei]
MVLVNMEHSENDQNHENDRRIFSFFHFFHIYSPFYLLSSPHRLLRYPALILTVATVLLMIFRFYWMLWQVPGEFLSFSWAEAKMFGFISMESAILTMALIRMGWTKSLERSEKNLANLRTLRVEKCQKKKDDYRILYCRAFISNCFVFCTFTLTSVYLAVHRDVTEGDSKHSSWYWIIDPIIAILCGYSNFLFLPIHALRAHAVTREFEIFNEELEKTDKEKKLANLSVIREYGARQIKLFEYANFLTERMERFMTWAPALAILSFLMATYIVTEFSSKPPVLYLICMIAWIISGFIISFALMYPVAFIQEAMSQTARVLLNSTILQECDEPLIFENYRMLLDRSLHNRSTNNVLHVFCVTRKNVERLFFTHSILIIVMVYVYSLDEGIGKGFEEIGKLIMMKGNATG